MSSNISTQEQERLMLLKLLQQSVAGSAGIEQQRIGELQQDLEDRKQAFKRAEREKKLRKAGFLSELEKRDDRKAKSRISTLMTQLEREDEQNADSLIDIASKIVETLGMHDIVDPKYIESLNRRVDGLDGNRGGALAQVAYDDAIESASQALLEKIQDPELRTRGSQSNAVGGPSSSLNPIDLDDGIGPASGAGQGGDGGDDVGKGGGGDDDDDDDDSEDSDEQYVDGATFFSNSNNQQPSASTESSNRQGIYRPSIASPTKSKALRAKSSRITVKPKPKSKRKIKVSAKARASAEQGNAEGKASARGASGDGDGDGASASGGAPKIRGRGAKKPSKKNSSKPDSIQKRAMQLAGAKRRAYVNATQGEALRDSYNVLKGGKPKFPVAQDKQIRGGGKILNALGELAFDGLVAQPLRKVIGDRGLRAIAPKAHRRINANERRSGKKGQKAQDEQFLLDRLRRRRRANG